MRYIVAAFLIALFGGSTLAQSRGPELKVPEYAKIKAEALADSTDFEERPYFILVDESEKALKDGKYDDAARRLVEAMGIEPDNPLNVALMSNLGMIYYYNGQDSLALRCLDEVVSRSPRLIAGHENRAKVLVGIGRDKEAFDEYGKVIELDSLNTDAHFYHGMMALHSGRLAEAEKDFAVLEEIVPVARTTYLALGTLYAMTSRETEAATYLRKLVDVEPEPEYCVMLFDCYMVSGNYADASDVIGKAIERYPEDGELYICRARLNKARYDNEAACRDAETAVKYGIPRSRVEALFKK